MATAISFDDAKQLRKKSPTSNNVSKTPFFGSRNTPDEPHATFNQYDPGHPHAGKPHFHIHDQFQVVIEGAGRIGRHDISPYCVHFSRAYTPYGPVATDGGLGFIVMRPHYDPGSQKLPKELGQLKRQPNRQPWQITRSVTFPALPSGGDTMLQPIPGMKDEQGLAAYVLTMGSNARTSAPDPSHGNGQYIVVLKGSLLRDGKDLKAPTLVWVYPKDGAFQMYAGPAGLEALVLNFPQEKPRGARSHTTSVAAGFKKWQCTLCSFAYDEALGMPDEGIPAGTRWADVPDDWKCPDCSTSKSDFQMVEV